MSMKRYRPEEIIAKLQPGEDGGHLMTFGRDACRAASFWTQILNRISICWNRLRMSIPLI
jgi:hypothetical protein